MATRVNTRFLLILFVVVASSVVVVGGLWYLKYRGDAERNVRAGDEFMRTGDYENAKNYYGRAVNKQPTNLDYLAKMEEALLKIQPETADKAGELYGEYMGILRHAAAHAPTDPQTHLRLIREAHEAARRTQAVHFWSLVDESAENMERRIPSSNPEHAYAKLYFGAARLSPALADQLTAEEIREGERAINEYLRTEPDSDMGWAVLIRAQLAEARRLALDGQESRAEEELQKAGETAAEAMAAVPDGPEVLVATLRVKLFERSMDMETDTEDELRAMVLEALRLVRESDDLTVTARAADVVERLAWIDGLPSAAAVVQEYLADHPEALDLRLITAALLFRDGELDEAETNLRTILDANFLTTGLLSQMQFMLKQQAAALNVDIAHQRWFEADEVDRPALLEIAVGRRDALAAMVTDAEDDPQLIRANGKIAFAQGDFATATKLFDRLVREDPSVTAETLWYAALSLERQGNPGLAATRMMQALDRRPDNLPLLFQAGRLLLRTHQWELAAVVAENLRPHAADDPSVRQLVAAIDRVGAGADPEWSDDPVQVAMRTARAAATNGDTGAARAALVAVLEDHPNDLRLLYFLSGLEIRDGNKEQAAIYIDRGLELVPQDSNFLRLKAANESDDPIERTIRYAESLEEEEIPRLLQTMRALQLLAGVEDRNATQFEVSGRPDDARNSRDLAARARSEAEARRPQVEAEAPDHPDLIEYLFVRAVVNDDRETVDQIVRRAGELDVDQAGGAMYEGRAALARGEIQPAVLAFRRATERIPWSATAWRSLAMTYQQAGNNTDALTAFERAHENNPNDLVTIQQYATLLDRTGEKTRALVIARTGRREAPGDAALRDLWLTLEAEAGDPAVVLRERERMYEEEPGNRRNAAALASLFGKTEPARETLLDEDGEARYTAERWGRMAMLERHAILEAAQQEWYDRADQIVEDLGLAGDRDLSWHLLRADLLRARGRIDAGEAALREYADGLPAGEEKLLALLALGMYDMQVNRFPEARRVYEQARQFQADERREADYYLADLNLREGRHDEAIVFFEALLEGRAEQTFQLPVIDLAVNHSVRIAPYSRLLIEQQIIQCYINVRQFDEARTRMETLLQENEPDYLTTLLEASLVEGEADRLWAANDRMGAQRKYQEHTEILRRAETLSPSSPQPHVLRAHSLMKAAQRTNDPPLLDDALRVLDRADEVQADSPMVSLARVQILQTMGNTRGAINELQRLLEALPEHTEARRLLVQLLLESNRPDAAIEVVTAAVNIDPTSAPWREQLGDLYLTARQDPVAAADQYMAALQVAPSSRLVAKSTEALMTRTPPDFRAAISLIERFPSEIEADPVLRLNYVRALAGTGSFDQCREQMRLAYARLREQIAAGERAPDMIGIWFQNLRAMFTVRQGVQAEQFAMEVAGGELNPYEMRAMAAFWGGMGRDGWSRAIELLQTAIPRCTQDQRGLMAGMYGDLGTVLLLAGQLEAANDAFVRVLEVYPDNYQVLNNLAYLLSESLGRPEEALQYAQRAAELRPGDWQVLDTLAWIYYLTGAYDEAESYLRTSIQLESAVENNLHLAHVFFKVDDFEKAQRYLQRATILNEAETPPDPQTREEIHRLADDIRTKSRGQG